MQTYLQPLTTRICAWVMLAFLMGVPLGAQVMRQAPAPPPVPAMQQPPGQPASPFGGVEEHRQTLGSWEIDFHAFVALPLATLLGAALALRPRTRGTPKR